MECTLGNERTRVDVGYTAIKLRIDIHAGAVLATIVQPQNRG